MKDVTDNLPKAIRKILNPPLSLPAIENEEKAIDLEGEEMKFIIPSNIIDIWPRVEMLVGLKLSGYTDTLTKASSLIDELYIRCEIQNEEQYRNALDKFSYSQKNGAS